ncbi:hypothetical protein GE061_001944 [Apolygus lucorum]|uniref:Uncharacterized protein n=1 Tax=Apolygus lucorum TaxID=248454 RepID=A0A6A4J8K1_APOLU|nr:hypothetical protein GE061_001944 [Apolygus lucorum]
MKTLVFVCLFGSVFCNPWGSAVYDTPEVAAAKASHLAALAKAHQEAHQSSLNAQDRSGVEDDGSYSEEKYGSEKGDDASWKEDDGSWKSNEQSWAPQAHSWTPQAQQWSQPQVHQAVQGHYHGAEKKWTGPVALPPGFDKNGAPLQVLDTPEVAAEKAKHFHLYAHSAHKAAPPAHAGSHANSAAPSWAPQAAHSWH